MIVLLAAPPGDAQVRSCDFAMPNRFVNRNATQPDLDPDRNSPSSATPLFLVPRTAQTSELIRRGLGEEPLRAASLRQDLPQCRVIANGLELLAHKSSDQDKPEIIAAHSSPVMV